jgi:hypothetical protein
MGRPFDKKPTFDSQTEKKRYESSSRELSGLLISGSMYKSSKNRTQESDRLWAQQAQV